MEWWGTGVPEGSQGTRDIEVFGVFDGGCGAVWAERTGTQNTARPVPALCSAAHPLPAV